jgi:hypothetical protein
MIRRSRNVPTRPRGPDLYDGERRFPAPHDATNRARLLQAEAELWGICTAPNATTEQRNAAAIEHREVKRLLGAAR